MALITCIKGRCHLCKRKLNAILVTFFGSLNIITLNVALDIPMVLSTTFVDNFFLFDIDGKAIQLQ